MILNDWLNPVITYPIQETDMNDEHKSKEQLIAELKELRKTRERLELALSGADLGLWDWDLTTGRTFWNERAISMLGYSGEDVRPDLHFWKSLVHPEDWAEVSERLNAHLEGRLPLVETEHRLRCKSGEWKWILARGKVAERDKGGKPLRMAGTTLDIDERKRTEKELRQSEALYRAIFHNAATGINLNCHGKVSEVNSAWTRMLGYSQGELMGLTFLDVTHPDDLEISKRYHDALLRGETDSYRLEKRYIRKDGQVLWADVWVSAIRDEAGQYQATIAAVIDITDKKHAEEALQRSEANFRSIFDSMNDAVFVHDLETGRILDVNRKMCEMFGYTADEARGLSVGQISLGEPPYSQEDSLQWIARAIQAGPQLFEWLCKDKAGRLFQAEVSLKRAAIEGQDRVLAVVRDISDRKRAEREKENLMAQLVQAQKNQAIGTLAGGIAHDFNNLLTIILGYSELLVQDTPATDPKHADLRKIVETAASGADLVKRLLTFSRRADSEPRPLNLNSRIAQIKELLSKTIPKMVRIDLVLAGDLAPIHADPAQMDQVVMNLAMNAAESMPDGGILTIETGNVHLDDQFCRTHHGMESGEYVLLRVSDSGCGMDKQTMERMFDPFFTAKGWDFRKGKGLGLAVVRGVVQQHGGYLGCDSEAGKGTTFVIYFPVRKEEGGSTEMKTEAPPVGRAETILLVDDEEYIRDLAKRHLSRAGYTVLEAADGQEAVEVYRKELKSISIVILDLVMPEMGGKRCLEKLVGINPGVRVLVMTGFSADQVDEDLRNNVRAFLTKPFDMRQLVEAVREVLDSD